MPASVNCFMTVQTLTAWLESVEVKPWNPPTGMTAASKVAPDAVRLEMRGVICEPVKGTPGCACPVSGAGERLTSLRIPTER